VYFLQAMQQWMTDTGKVEIELPNGQKVTLDSIKVVKDAINDLGLSIGKGLSINDNGYTEIYPSDKNKAGLWQRINTSVFEVLSGSTGKFSVANDSVKIGGTIDVKTNTPGNDQSRVEITSPDGRFSIGMWGYNDGRTLVSCRNTSGWSNVSF
ncbi:hypothetical protein OFJ69_005666, partial [Escherichia coli]|nr:hypothetical protein [Escherichia coli]